MERHELIKKYEKRLQKENPSRIEQLYCEIIRDLFDLEQTKVEVPEFIADWIETAKTVYSLSGGMTYGGPVVNKWLDNEDNQRTFALAWFDGYTVDKPKRYLVKIKGMVRNNRYLKYNTSNNHWYFNGPDEFASYRSTHTYKELEDAGFGEVFNSPLFEVEEVEI